MPTKAISSDLIRKFPQNVRDHLFDDALAEKYGEIFESVDLQDEQAEKARDLVWQIYAKNISLPEFLSALERETGLSKEVSKKLAVQIIGWDFLPVADFLGVDVAGFLREIGADPNLFMQTVNSREVAEDLARNTGLRFEEERFDRRLVDIILNRLNNVRDDLETKDILTRGVKLGGLELDEVKAGKILDLIKLELESLAKKRVVLREEKEAIVFVEAKLHSKEVSLPSTRNLPPSSPPPSKPLPPAPRPAPPPLPVIASPPKADKAIPLVEAERRQETSNKQQEIRDKQQETSNKQQVTIRKSGDILAPDEAKEITTIVAKALTSLPSANKILSESLIRVRGGVGLNFDDAIQKRFDQILVNRLKDIRDSQETKEMLERATNLGGVGLTKEDSDKVIKILDNEFSRVHEDLRTAKEAEIRLATRKKSEEAEKKSVETEKKEKDELETRWQGLIKRQETRDRRQATRDKRQETGDKQQETRDKRQEQPPTPNLEDVKFTPRLVGQLEEMKNFSLDDLRKLSTRPSDAAGRLLDKLEVLRGEATEKKIAGIGALKTSPLWQSYTEIVNQALISGKNSSDIIASQLALDKSGMSQDEFNAIMLLSGQLRY